MRRVAARLSADRQFLSDADDAGIGSGSESETAKARPPAAQWRIHDEMAGAAAAQSAVRTTEVPRGRSPPTSLVPHAVHSGLRVEPLHGPSSLASARVGGDWCSWHCYFCDACRPSVHIQCRPSVQLCLHCDGCSFLKLFVTTLTARTRVGQGGAGRASLGRGRG